MALVKTPVFIVQDLSALRGEFLFGGELWLQLNRF